MSKVSGAYPSLSRGVSQQPFEARLDGQHGEQVNMWSDPVRGLSRRRGTQLQDCKPDNVFGPSYFQLTEEQKAELRAFYASYRVASWVTQGAEFVVHYPTAPLPVWMRDPFKGGQGGIKVTRKIQNSAPHEKGAVVESVFLGDTSTGPGASTLTKVNKGFATGCQVGRYFMLYPQDTKFATAAEVDRWDVQPWSCTIEVRQGVPNRTYTVSGTVAGTNRQWSYTTPSSSYSGTLDTSDIQTDDPNYVKRVNDRVNAYNSAVTAWITTAAQQTRPAHIALQLAAAIRNTFNLAGLTATHDAYISGAEAVVLVRATLPMNTSSTRDFSCSDGGDGSTLLVTERVVTNIDQLPQFAAQGAIVQVRPSRGTDSFYMRAVYDGTGRVRWEEGTRYTLATPLNPLVVLAYNPGNPNAICASDSFVYLKSASMLNDPSIEALEFSTRLIGDQDSNPTPHFFNKQVTWMGMFQDRLCIAAGAVVNMSEVGNYFNFFRTQTLTVPDKDPVEIFALGAEADTIRHSVLFDRSLLLFGDLQQYSIDGRIPVTPASTTVIQSGAIEDATDCPPVAGGSLVFFGKRREGSTEVFQIEVGDVADTSRYSGLGLQLSDYIPGKPAQLLYIGSPGILVCRTDAAPHSLFIFRFIDQGGQRLLDSWSRFDYHPAFGIIQSVFYHDDAIYMRVVREAWVDEDGTVWTGGRGDHGFDVLERQSILPQVPTYPYLDSLRPASNVWSASGYGVDFHQQAYPFLASAFASAKLTAKSSGSYVNWLHGAVPNVRSLVDFDAQFADLTDRDVAYLGTGIPFDSYVQLTSPVRRDQNQQPILQARLTVNRLDVYYRESGGFSATVDSRFGLAKQHNNFDWTVTNTAYGKVTALRFNGRTIGASTNMAGVQPVVSGTAPVFIGRESREYTCTLAARTWMPFSITRVTWTGQTFMNHRFI